MAAAACTQQGHRKTSAPPAARALALDLATVTKLHLHACAHAILCSVSVRGQVAGDCVCAVRADHAASSLLCSTLCTAGWLIQTRWANVKLKIIQETVYTATGSAELLAVFSRLLVP